MAERSSDLSTLGGRIRAARQDLAMHQAELAERVGVTERTVRNWESGARLPRMRKLGEIAAALDVQASWLMEAEAVAA